MSAPSDSAFAAAYRRSLEDPQGFWGEAAAALHWFAPYDRVLDDDDAPFYRWFVGGRTNVCYNALDRHVEAGRAEQPALIYHSAMTGARRTLTYRALTDETARFAGALAAQGVEYGDRVVIYMPMVPEAVVAMLACARLGAVHSVVFGGFAAPELAARIDDCRPKLLVAASCGLEPGRTIAYHPLMTQALELAEHKPARCIVLQREEQPATLDPARDLDWHAAIADAEPVPCAEVLATDPHYILYTSGTTGQPKGIVRDTGGAVMLQWTMPNIYQSAPGERFWAASDIGWVVGHSYIVYAPLLNGNTTLMFEGKPVGTPDAAEFWRVIAEHKVSTLFTAPTALRAIKREDPDGSMLADCDLSGFRALFLAGERTDTDTLNWARERLGVPVIDHWWQTETGSAIAANCLGLGKMPIKDGSSSHPVPGWHLEVLDAEGQPRKSGEIGALAAKLPLPPGCLSGIWGAQERYFDTYLKNYPGYYETGDAGFLDEDGYVFVMARTDDVINVAGHRLATGALEEVLCGHPDVAEAAVIGVQDALKGELPLGLVVLNRGVERAVETVIEELVARIREHVGAVAAFRKAAVVARLPKTRSGKILRGTMKKIADGSDWNMPATVDDPAIFDEIAEALKSLNYPPK